MQTQKVLEIKRVVTEEMTAQAVGSGSLAVLGTPVLAAMLEEAACTLLQRELSAEETSVGVQLNLSHSAATPVGMEVTARAVLTERDGKTASFLLEAFDRCGEIGRGNHSRVVVNAGRFLEKVRQKGL